MKSKLREFTVNTPRPLPVVVLADVSGSMSADGKIDALNRAIEAMIGSLAPIDAAAPEIQLAVITFGGAGPVEHVALQPASNVKWSPMAAAGKTPLGGAIELARALIEDRERIPGRAYRPAIVLVSDGQPTDEWKPALAALLASSRASKATRFAMAIGADADEGVLREFLGDSAAALFRAADAADIRKFFRWVTMSVQSRSKSANPDAPEPAAAFNLDRLEF